MALRTYCVYGNYLRSRTKLAVTSHKGGPRLGEGRFVMGSRLCVLSQIYMTLSQPPERKVSHIALPSRFIQGDLSTEWFWKNSVCDF